MVFTPKIRKSSKNYFFGKKEKADTLLGYPLFDVKM